MAWLGWLTTRDANVVLFVDVHGLSRSVWITRWWWPQRPKGGLFSPYRWLKWPPWLQFNVTPALCGFRQKLCNIVKNRPWSQNKVSLSLSLPHAVSLISKHSDSLVLKKRKKNLYYIDHRLIITGWSCCWLTQGMQISFNSSFCVCHLLQYNQSIHCAPKEYQKPVKGL